MADATGRAQSGVFGIDTPYSVGHGAVDERGRLKPEALAPLWNEIAPRFSGSRSRIKFTEDVTMGKIRAPVPRKFARNRNVFSPMIPQQITVALHNHNVLGRKDPDLKRYTSGTGVTPLARATRIEQWINPMQRKLTSWGELIGMLQDAAEMGAAVMPAAVMPQQTPPPFKEDDDDPDSPPRPEWWRDRDGKGIEHYIGKEDFLKQHRDGKKTADAYEEALMDWRLDHPPISVSLIHATECVPIGLRIMGDGPQIDGLLVRGTYSRTELLRRQLLWGTGPSLEAETRTGTRDVELLTGYMSDASGLPYLVYSVNGMTTRWAGGTDSDWAFIDLFKEYGMTRLLAFYEYGWHRSVRDPDARGIPFAFPNASGWLTAQAMIGAAVANFWNRGHGARGIKPNENAPREAYMDGSNPRKISWEPGGDLPVLPGEVVDMLPQVISPDAWRIVDILMGNATEQSPPPGAFGGEGPNSGRERTVIRRHMEDSQDQIFGGGLRMWQKIGSGVLELASKMTQLGICKPIPVETNIPLTEDGGGNRRKGLIKTLDPRDCAGNYSLEAVFLPKPGENLALAEQAKGLVQAGLRPRRWFHEEIMGDESPEQTEAEITSDALIYGEAGQEEIRELAKQIRNEEQQKQRDELREQGLVSPSGAPMSMAGGLQGPAVSGPAPAPGGPEMAAAGGPAPVGTGMPNPGAAALGGAVAPEMETAAMLGDARLLGGG